MFYECSSHLHAEAAGIILSFPPLISIRDSQRLVAPCSLFSLACSRFTELHTTLSAPR